MAGGARQERRRQRACTGAAAFRSPCTALVAALALLVQIIVFPYHQAQSAPRGASAGLDVTAVAAELRATFGDDAALCVQTDDKGAPAAPAGDCDSHCPLCRFAAEAATLVAPDLPALPVRLDETCIRLGFDPGAETIRRSPASRPRARAPPFAV